MNTINLSYFKQCAPSLKTTRIFQKNLLLLKFKRPHKESKGMNCHTATAGICYRQPAQDRPTIATLLQPASVTGSQPKTGPQLPHCYSRHLLQAVSPRQAHNSTFPCYTVLSFYCTNNKCLYCPMCSFTSCICSALLASYQHPHYTLHQSCYFTHSDTLHMCTVQLHHTIWT